MLVYAIISPHPPIIVPEVGKGEERRTRRTIAALKHAARELAKTKPDELIIIAPHEGHGFEVPLYYLGKHLPGDMPVHQELVTEPSYEYYYRFGLETGRLIAESATRYAVVASGDLSHVLKADGPYGYDPAGPKLDKLILKAVRDNNPRELLELDPQLLEDGAECGLRSILFLMGVIEITGFVPAETVYEGPFGVGYLTATYRRDDSGPDITALARRSIEHFLGKGKLMTKPKTLPAELMAKAGAFVSLHEPDGQLRGCIGTTKPTKTTLAAEIIANSVAAATEDPRFEPVTPQELGALHISVDVLGAPRPADARELDAKQYGIIVTAKDGRQGVLLPDIDGVDTVEEQISIARGKAGIGPDESIQLQKFQVKRFTERTSEPAQPHVGAGPAF